MQESNTKRSGLFRQESSIKKGRNGEFDSERSSIWKVTEKEKSGGSSSSMSARIHISESDMQNSEIQISDDSSN